ncbi:MAG: hypothetical protein AABW84_01875 [Nanoarchaeota archaeon]
MLFDWMNSRIKKFDWIDIKLIKIAALVMGLPIGAYFAAKILPYWWVFVIAAILIGIRPHYKLFTKS